MEIHTHASPGLGVEEGTNTRPGEAAEKRENAGAGAALERGSQAGTDADGLAYENKPTRRPSVAAEWAAHAGGSMAARIRTVPGLAMPGLSMKIRLEQYFVSALSAPQFGPFSAAFLGKRIAPTGNRTSAHAVLTHAVTNVIDRCTT